MINVKRASLLAVVLAGTGLALAGCASQDTKVAEPFHDAPKSGVINNASVDIITDADGFSNLATKCDHGNRLYIAFHGDGAYGSVTVVKQDSTCKGDTSIGTGK